MLYENIMNKYKHETSQEILLNIGASFIAGSFAAAFTNPLEMISVNKMTNRDLKIIEFVKKEGVYNLCF
jgi:hypothetical protein